MKLATVIGLEGVDFGQGDTFAAWHGDKPLDPEQKTKGTLASTP